MAEIANVRIFHILFRIKKVTEIMYLDYFIYVLTLQDITLTGKTYKIYSSSFIQ